jgi:hypothetical protein
MQRIFKASFVIAAVALAAPFAISVLSLGGLAAVAGLRSLSVDVPLPWIVLFDGPHTLVALLFADPLRYLVFSLLALLLFLGWLIQLAIHSRGNVSRLPQFYLLVLGVVCVLGFAWLHPYEPAVRPAHNAQLQMVEAPDWVMGVARRNQVSAEIPGCAFEALGWADAHTLVYRKWCGGFFDPNNHYAWKEGTPTPPRAYRVDTKSDLPYTGDLTALVRETCSYWSCVRPLLEKDSILSSSPSSRYPAIPNDSVVSPDGKWVAFRARHVYGPEDLLVVATAEAN